MPLSREAKHRQPDRISGSPLYSRIAKSYDLISGEISPFNPAGVI
jgi:hypothetical protein